jgi:hypothetical protein
MNKKVSKQYSKKLNKNNINNITLSSSSDSDIGDKDPNITETKNNILKAFDDRINKNKEELKQITLLQQKKTEIFKLAKDLKVDIKNLDSVINDIVKKQHDDYLNTFSSFMDSIRKELTQKLEEMEKKAEEEKKSNDIRLIKCERDFFRMEAVRLNGICKSFKEKIDELAFKNKLITDELNILKIKWKESENINKQLLFELESNIQNYKVLEEKYNSSVINPPNKKDNLKININRSMSNENRHLYNSDIKEKNKTNYIHFKSESKDYEGSEGLDGEKYKEIIELNERIKKYKNDAKIFKDKAYKTSAELTKIYLERNKLENIFNDCVNATKKIIYQRKLKDNKSYKIKNKTGFGKYDIKMDFTTKYSEFLPGDKMSTLENFLFNDQVYNFVKDAIFKHPQGNNKKKENTKKLLNDYNFYDPDWKMKEIIENVSSDFSKNNNVLPVMNINNKNQFNQKGKDKAFSQFYKTGKISINPINLKSQQIGTSSKLTMNLQV